MLSLLLKHSAADSRDVERRRAVLNRHQPAQFVHVDVPDMFKTEGGSDVIVEGTFRGGTLQAQSVLTSCPSKYEAGAPGGAGS